MKYSCQTIPPDMCAVPKYANNEELQLYVQETIFSFPNF